MSAKRRPVQPPAGLQQRLDRSMNDGSLGGGIANAAPLVQGGRLRARSQGLVPTSSGSGGVQFATDEFVLGASGSQAVTLTYQPRPKSEHVYLNTMYSRESLDWTRSGQVITLTNDLDVRAGDVVTVEYAYLGGLSTLPTGVIVPWSASDWKNISVAMTSTADYSATTFDDSTWAVGTAPFGNGVNTGNNGTGWVADTDLWMRRVIPAGANFTVDFTIEDHIEVWWNGVKLYGPSSGTPTTSEPAQVGMRRGDSIVVPASAVAVGTTQVLAVRAGDEAASGAGDSVYVNVQVRGVLS